MKKERINPWEKIKELEKSLRGETEKNEKLKKDLDKTSKRLADATKLVAENEEQIRNSRKYSAEQKNILNTQVDLLKLDVAGLNKSCKDKDREIKKLQKGRKGWQSRVGTLEKEAAALKETWADPAKVIKEADKKIKSSTKALTVAANKERRMRLDLADAQTEMTRWKIRYVNAMKLFTGEGSTNFFPVDRKFLEDIQSLLKTVIVGPGTDILLPEINGHIDTLLESKKAPKKPVKEKEEKKKE